MDQVGRQELGAGRGGRGLGLCLAGGRNMGLAHLDGAGAFMRGMIMRGV